MEQAFSHKKNEVSGSLRLQEASAIWHFRVLRKLLEARRQTARAIYSLYSRGQLQLGNLTFSEAILSKTYLACFSEQRLPPPKLQQTFLSKIKNGIVRTEGFQIAEIKRFNQL